MSTTATMLILTTILSATAIPPSQDSPKLALYDRTQRLCVGLALASTKLAQAIESSGASSLRDVCECAALLTVAPLSEDQATTLMSSAGGREDFVIGLGETVKQCYAMNVSN